MSNSQKQEKTHMSTNRRTEKLFLFIKWNTTQQEREWIADIDKSMDEPHRHYVVWRKPTWKCPDVNYMYRGDYFTTQINIKSLPCTPEANICQLYLNKKIFRWQRERGKGRAQRILRAVNTIMVDISLYICPNSQNVQHQELTLR